MEIGRINHNINKNLIRAIAKTVESYYNGLKFQQLEIENAN